MRLIVTTISNTAWHIWNVTAAAAHTQQDISDVNVCFLRYCDRAS
jgi:hypothetical protein